MTKRNSTNSGRIACLVSSYSVDIKTIYLFVCNYNGIIILWSTVGAICSRRRHQERYGTGKYSEDVLFDTIKSFVLPFVWITLVALSFSISNQRLPSNVLEDRLNKSWRPIPSQRITPQKASVLLMIINIIGFIFSWAVGANTLYFSAIGTSYLYNDRGGGDSHYVIRDSLNGIGLTTWAFGAMSAASGPNFGFSKSDPIAGVIMFLAIATTIGIQDFRDLLGDRECGRHTLPLLIGELKARCILATFILAWSFGIARTSNLSLISAHTVLGVTIALRLVLFRECESDKRTLELWYGWGALLLPTLV